VGDLDRQTGLWHTRRHLSSAIDAHDALFAPIQHDSDTAFDLLPSRICDSRHVGARNLGRPASHGCIRLSPQNARTLFGLVGRHGMRNTSISISY